MENKKQIRVLEIEQSQIGGYKKRYADLSRFREGLSTYLKVEYKSNGKMQYEPKITVLKSGHILDHHVLGYFAPMRFKRTGFGNSLRTPIEQLQLLRQELEKKNMRFIYVPLPCKLAIYPWLSENPLDIPFDGLVIPQWRNMLYELYKQNMEIVDCYPKFQKDKGTMLFSKNHHIAPAGAHVIAKAISEYLKQTTTWESLSADVKFVNERRTIEDPVLRISGDYTSEKLGSETFDVSHIKLSRNHKIKTYVGNEVESEISIIGDCNLQSYRNMGCDITALLSYELNYPVNYGGRYLPFARIDSIDKMPKSILCNKKICIYVGFVSASFVRAYHAEDYWSKSLMSDDAFMKE